MLSLTDLVSRRHVLKLLAAGAAGPILNSCTWRPGREYSSTPSVSASLSTQPTPAEKVKTSTTSVESAAPRPSTTSSAVSYARLPRWRGFNLLEKFTLANNQPYQEWDFDTIAAWGFDFVRLPTDYRIWTIAPGAYDEKSLQEIDQAIAWGRERHIHVNLCLHRAPGYCVNPPREKLDLWADGTDGEEARRQFAAQWKMFAARYQGIPPEELSFNLVNEPAEITAEQYLRAAQVAVDAIRQEDPHRLVIADGRNWGTLPALELTPLKIAQSTRGYQPFQLTHYKAEWAEGSDNWPEPTWPVHRGINQFLYGDEKPEFRAPLILEFLFSQPVELTILVNMVSHRARLQILADQEIVLQKLFEPGAGQGEWKRSEYKSEWQIYQAVYDRPYTAQIPGGTKRIQIELLEGDWLTFSEIRLEPFPGAPSNQLVLKPADMEWGRQQPGAVEIDERGQLNIPGSSPLADKETLWQDYVEPLVRLAQSGIGVHVGEWGAYRFTPHSVVLSWMEDCLENWQRAGFGWALWNLRGAFGVLDSQREDVRYENYQGHLLDRQMLELLQRF